ncbi:MAG TPA: efflux RND transporter periplasmic adaptor subunit [Gammaproteobacteria bacterium]
MHSLSMLCVAVLLMGASALPAFAAEQERSVLFYRNPMNPAITSPVPAKDSMGMDYIPVYADAETGPDAAVVRIDPAIVQNLGVRTEAVTRGKLERRIDAVGAVAYDEGLVAHIHPRSEGWIENLYVHTEGERVGAGDVLFEIYSPLLNSAQDELLQALRIGQADLVAASRERLRLLGVDDEQIRALERSRKATARIAVRAPQNGVVTQLNARHGMYVKPDMEVMALSDTSSVWVLAEVPERQAAWVAPGQAAEVRLPATPGEVFDCSVEFVYPELDLKTRTLRARLRFDNPGEVLKPGMYADVRIFAGPKDAVLSIPQQALIRAGDTDRVVVALGEGRFRAVDVVAGMESGERIEIREGVREGDLVVVSGQFLIDSEASIKASALRMQGAATPTAGAGVDAAAEQKPKAQTEPEQSIGGEGTVTAVMADHSMLTLDHAPIEALGWPAMTMDFNVAPEVDLSGIKVGERIHFMLEQDEDGAYRIGVIHEME